MAKKIKVTEAKASLSELMARAGYGGERFLIERRGRPLAALVGAEDLERLEGGAEGSEGGLRRPRGALALVGVGEGLIEDEEIDAMLDDIYSSRERDTGRPVDLPGA